MTNIASFQTLIQTNIETKKAQLSEATERFVKNPMYGLDFGWHMEMAVYDEIVKYYTEINDEALWAEMTDDSAVAHLRRWINRLILETSPIKRDVWKHIIKFWYNVADMYKVDLGDLKDFRYSF